MKTKSKRRQPDMLNGTLWNNILLFAMLSYLFCLFYEVMGGYLRGYEISLAPATLTTVGVCGTRIAWIKFVFPHFRSFRTIMTVYPVSLSVTALLIFGALMFYRSSKHCKGCVAR